MEEKNTKKLIKRKKQKKKVIHKVYKKCTPQEVLILALKKRKVNKELKVIKNQKKKIEINENKKGTFKKI